MAGVVHTGVLVMALVLTAAGAWRRADDAGFGRELSAGCDGVGQILPSPGDIPSPTSPAQGRRPAHGLNARLDLKRRLAYHERFLREVADSGPKVEVAWDVEVVRRSLRFVAENGARAGAKTSAAVARLFARTEDGEARRLCLAALYRVNNERAKHELLLVARDLRVEARWRELSVCLLRLAVSERQRVPAADAKALPALGTAGGR